MPTPPLPSLAITRTLPRTVDVLVVGFAESGVREVPEPVAREFANRYGTSVSEMADQPRRERQGGSPADPARIGPVSTDRRGRAGLGRPDPGGVAPGGGRRSAPCRGPGRRPPLSVAVSLGTGEPEEAQAVAEGALLGSYRYAPISSDAGPGPQDRLAHRRASTAGQFGRDRGGGRACGPSRRRCPRLGQHPRQPALPRVVRRPGPPAGRGHPDRGRRARRQGAEPGRLRRTDGGRRRVFPAAAAGPARVPRPGGPRRTWCWSARASPSTPVG